MTKYFKPGDEEKYRAGSFKFGTFIEYQNGESQRFTDREGLAFHHVYIQTNQPYSAKVGQVVHTNNIGIFEAHIETQFNDHVFCATEGLYRREHHLRMLEDDPKITCYAEINCRDFFEASLDFADGIEGARKHAEPQVLCGQVSYVGRHVSSHFGNEIDGMNYSGFSRDIYERTIFCKPEEFSHEKEIRYVMRLHAPNFAPADALPVYPKSAAFKAAIVRIGQI